jgi:hypothetical protein
MQKKKKKEKEEAAEERTVRSVRYQSSSVH